MPRPLRRITVLLILILLAAGCSMADRRLSPLPEPPPPGPRQEQPPLNPSPAPPPPEPEPVLSPRLARGVRDGRAFLFQYPEIEYFHVTPEEGQVVITVRAENPRLTEFIRGYPDPGLYRVRVCPDGPPEEK